MRIALDWDGTYTADPEFWDDFARLARARGHEVTIVTGRGPSEAIAHFLPIVYCSRTAKQNHYSADVWIDDIPRWVVENERG